jgi:transposase InsO family protein
MKSHDHPVRTLSLALKPNAHCRGRRLEGQDPPGSPWENGYCESFNGKMRDQLLNGELFYALKGAQIIIERWTIHYNTVRPHSSRGGKPPVPEAIQRAR